MRKFKFNLFGIVIIPIAIIALIKTWGTPLWWLALYLIAKEFELEFKWEK